MFDPFALRGEFFEGLVAIDEAIVERAAEEPCRDCGGPLHRGDYRRKPRGGQLAVAAESFTRRFSLCCGRDTPGLTQASDPPWPKRSRSSTATIRDGPSSFTTTTSSRSRARTLASGRSPATRRCAGS
jgi:hypothetical protein